MYRNVGVAFVCVAPFGCFRSNEMRFVACFTSRCQLDLGLCRLYNMPEIVEFRRSVVRKRNTTF